MKLEALQKVRVSPKSSVEVLRYFSFEQNGEQTSQKTDIQSYYENYNCNNFRNFGDGNLAFEMGIWKSFVGTETHIWHWKKNMIFKILF